MAIKPLVTNLIIGGFEVQSQAAVNKSIFLLSRGPG